MLQATRSAVEELSRDSRSPLVSDCLELATEYGTREDAAAVLPFLLDSHPRSDEIAMVVMRHGDLAMAHQVFEAYCHDGRLRDEAPAEILHCLGYLGYEPAESVLWHYAKRSSTAGAGEWATYEHHEDAVLGLLNLPCTQIASEIDSELRACFETQVCTFALPALLVKTGNWDLLQQICARYSEDGGCDREGAILSPALFGARGEPLFRSILTDPGWDVAESAKAYPFWAYLGCQALGIRLTSLFDELKARLQQDDDADQRRYELRLLTELLQVRLYAPRPLRHVPAALDSFAEIRSAMFSDYYLAIPPPDNSLIEIAYQRLDGCDDLGHQLVRLQDLLRLRMKAELLTREDFESLHF